MTAPRAAALACAGALVLAGCTAPAAPPPEPEVTAELRQSRSDAAGHLVQVTVTTRVPLHVVGVQLRSDGFAPLPPSPLDISLPAGARTDLPTSYGAADCSTAPARARALVRVRDDAADRELEVPLDLDLLRRLHVGECFDRDLAEQVTIVATTPGPPRLGQGRPSLPVVLRIDRLRSDRHVALTDLGAHVVFAVRSTRTERPILQLAPQQRSGELVVELQPSRCEAHALAENKRMSLLGVYVALDGGEPRLVTLTPDPQTRATIEAFAVAGCQGRSRGR